MGVGEGKRRQFLKRYVQPVVVQEPPISGYTLFPVSQTGFIHLKPLIPLRSIPHAFSSACK